VQPRRLRRDRSAVCDVLLDLGLHSAHQGLDFDAVRRDVGDFLDLDHDVRAGLGEADHAQTALALDDRSDGSVLELHDLGDLRQRPDGVELGGIFYFLAAPPGAGSPSAIGPPRRPRR